MKVDFGWWGGLCVVENVEKEWFCQKMSGFH